jgi:hypothetical protein
MPGSLSFKTRLLPGAAERSKARSRRAMSARQEPCSAGWAGGARRPDWWGGLDNHETCGTLHSNLRPVRSRCCGNEAVLLGAWGGEQRQQPSSCQPHPFEPGVTFRSGRFLRGLRYASRPDRRETKRDLFLRRCRPTNRRGSAAIEGPACPGCTLPEVGVGC